MKRGEPCPLCRKPISNFTLGKWQSTIGEHGLWPTSLKNLTQLASGEAFNASFRKQFYGKEATYLRWKEVFDVLEIVGGRGCHCTVRENMEQQELSITRSEDFVKLSALVKLCSKEFFNDVSLSVVACRRIFEVFELAMPPMVEKKVQRRKKQ